MTGAAEVAVEGEGAASAATLAEVARALDAGGARTFDASAFAEVTSLIARADALGGAAGDRLLRRAERCAAALEARFVAARAEATELVDSLHVAGDARARGALDKAIVAGDLTRVRRAARRRLVARRVAVASSDPAWHSRLVVEARLRGVEPRHDASSSALPHAPSPRAAIAALVRALYDRSLDEAAAACAVARATDAVPAASGPYNALALATRALGELGALSPAYLRAQLARLEDLGALLGLPAEASSPRARPRRR